MYDINKPVVYSCSGCSNLARMAHDIALTLDSDNLAEMSCVSGVVANVTPLVDIAKSGRKIIAIDGCSLGCTKACLDLCSVKVEHYFVLSDYGFDKRSIWDDSLSENNIALKNIYNSLYEAGCSYSKSLPLKD